MKDNFSAHADQYAQYRPHYPPEVYHFLKQHLSNRQRAWDCGTGNGQVAAELSTFFEEVYATDISTQQLMNAFPKQNIRYSKQRAEKTSFPDSFFDLITVAQAVHWFDFEPFYTEVRRTLKSGGLIAVMGYGLFKSNEATNRVISHFYREVIGPFWDSERRYLDEAYQTIPFPFEEIDTPPQFEYELEWSFERLVGYLSTWSAVKHYIKEKGEDPILLIEQELKQSFGSRGKVQFPILFRLGRV